MRLAEKRGTMDRIDSFYHLNPAVGQAILIAVIIKWDDLLLEKFTEGFDVRRILVLDF